MRRPLTVVQATALLRKHEYRPHSPKTISRRWESKRSSRRVLVPRSM